MNQAQVILHASGAVAEFKHMVNMLHQAEIEVIPDVVFNHTAEGNHLGPMLSLKGIDSAYYCRLAEDKRYYMDYTGCAIAISIQLSAVRHCKTRWADRSWNHHQCAGDLPS